MGYVYQARHTLCCSTFLELYGIPNTPTKVCYVWVTYTKPALPFHIQIPYQPFPFTFELHDISNTTTKVCLITLVIIWWVLFYTHWTLINSGVRLLSVISCNLYFHGCETQDTATLSIRTPNTPALLSRSTSQPIITVKPPTTMDTLGGFIDTSQKPRAVQPKMALPDVRPVSANEPPYLHEPSVRIDTAEIQLSMPTSKYESQGVVWTVLHCCRSKFIILQLFSLDITYSFALINVYTYSWEVHTQCIYTQDYAQHAAFHHFVLHIVLEISHSLFATVD